MTTKDKPIILGLGTPAYGAKIAMWQLDMWLQLGWALAQTEARFTQRVTPKLDVCGVDVARNRLILEAHQAGCNWLFLVDADTWHDDEGAGFDILQMISDADRAGATIIAPPVPRRDPSNTQYMIYDRFPHHMEPIEYLGKPPMECETVATAMCAINISWVVAKLPPPWFKFEWTDNTLSFLSEDAWFCRRVREHGGKVMVDGRFRAKHLQRPEILTGPLPVFGT